MNIRMCIHGTNYVPQIFTSRIISTDEDLSLRIESFLIINLRVGSTKPNLLYIVIIYHAIKPTLNQESGNLQESGFLILKLY